MINEEFKRYIEQRLAEIRKELGNKELSSTARDQLFRQEQMLSSADRMGRYSSGQAFRRFRRDYERRLARTGRPQTDTQ